MVHELAEMWADSIRNVSDETIVKVLDHIKHERGDQWPPNLAEFLSLCKELRVDSVAPLQLPRTVSDRCKHGYTVSDYLRMAKEASTGRMDKSEFGRMLEAHGIPSGDGPGAREERIEHHEQIIRSGQITTRRADQYHLCGYSGCRNAGSLSAWVGGASQWFCRDHFVR